MYKKVYDFYSDAGHGWLKVRRSEIDELGLTNKITSYSYQNKEYVYLEEDYDMNLFFEAKNFEVEARIHNSVRSRIRTYEKYHA